MTILFLSYRRADTSGYAGRLADALEARFGVGSVFQEVWKKGSGTVQRDRIRIALNLVYGAPRRYEAELQLSSDRNTLSGEVVDTSSNNKASLTLTRGK